MGAMMVRGRLGTFLLCLIAACAHQSLPIDDDLAAHSTLLRIVGEEGATPAEGARVSLGAYQIEQIDLSTEARVEQASGSSVERKPFSFNLRDPSLDGAWTVVCDVQLRPFPKQAEASIPNQRGETIECIILRETEPENKGYRLRVQGVGPLYGLQTGEVRREKTLFDIRSAHEEPDEAHTLGKITGFQVEHESRTVAFVEVGGERRIWMRDDVRSDLAPLVASSAVALSTFAKLTSQ
jgi:hypothetical protein